MAMKLSEVKAKTKVCTVEFMDETVDVSYFPAAMTPRILEDVLALAGKADNDAQDMALVGKMLEPVLDWWDVLDDDDQRIPPTQETIKDMPLPFLVKVLNDLQADLNPPANKG